METSEYKTAKTRAEKLTIWAWHSDAPHGGYLFYGNPNSEMPPYHLGGLENLVNGEWLVWGFTRRVLEMDVQVMEWKHNPRTAKWPVRPKLITIELRPADAATQSRRKCKEGGAK